MFRAQALESLDNRGKAEATSIAKVAINQTVPFLRF